MREVLSVIIGLIVASVIPATVLASLGPLDGEYHVHSILLSFLVFYPFSAAATGLLGLPAFLVLRPFRPGHWWSVSIAGSLLGVLVAVILRLPSRPNPHDFLVDGPLGAAAALAFWGIWRRYAPNPDVRAS